MFRIGTAARLVAATSAVAVVLPATSAFADSLRDNLTGSAESVTIDNGGSTTVTYHIQSNGGDGCNVDAANPGTMSANAPAGVTATPATVQFTACDDSVQTKSVVYTSSTAGTYTIAPTISGGKAGNNGYTVEQADISLTVAASAKQTQTITFDEPASPAAYGTGFNVNPTSSSGLPVSVAASGSCSVAPATAPATGHTVTMTSGTGDCTLTASQAGNSTFDAATSVLQKVTAARRAITVTADAKSKVYGAVDPTLTAQVTTGSLVNGDDLSGNLTRAAGENVGSYAIQQGTLTAGANYALTFAGANLTIGTKTVDVTAHPKSKTYGTADPQLTYTATGLLGQDTVSGNLTRVAGENVGTRAIQQGSLTAGANYDINFTGAALTITPKALTGSITASDRAYDGTTDASVAGAPLSGVLTGDAVTLQVGAGSFDSKNVGDRTATAGLSLDGAQAGNYSVNPTASAPAKITPKGLTGSITASDRAYDGTTVASVAGAPLSGVLTGDAVTLQVGAGSFDSKNVGDRTATAGLSLDGAQAGNYSVNPTASAPAKITPKGLTGSFTVADKVWDGNRNATITGSQLHSGVVSGEDVTLDGSAASALFQDADTGSAKTVTSSGFSLSGEGRGNYSLSMQTATASILRWTYGTGFKSPVTMDSTKVNQLKGGSTVPLKFNVYAGTTEVTANVGTVFARTQACESGDATVSVLVESTSASSLRYDTTGAHWVYNWKAPTGTGCYKVGLTLTDGTVLAADFKVTK